MNGTSLNNNEGTEEGPVATNEGLRNIESKTEELVDVDPVTAEKKALDTVADDFENIIITKHAANILTTSAVEDITNTTIGHPSETDANDVSIHPTESTETSEQVEERGENTQSELEGNTEEDIVKIKIASDVNELVQTGDLPPENLQQAEELFQVEINPENIKEDENELVNRETEALRREKERQELLEKHKQLLERRRAAGSLNIQLQTKLAEYFRRKKADAAEQSMPDSGSSSVIDNMVDFVQRYSKYIVTLLDTRNQFLSTKEDYDRQVTELRDMCDHRQKDAADAHANTISFLMSYAKKAISAQTGRTLNVKDYEAYLALLEKKEALVTDVRLENIKMQFEVNKIDAIFKSQEDLAEGLHLIDFEQLKIENQTYNEKIEERIEETGKLRRKITNTVQTMTHFKEKLQCCLSENTNLKSELAQTETALNFNRDKLTHIKQSRDALRADYARLQRSCGLLGKPELLRNYENCMDAVEAKRSDLTQLREKTNGFLQQANKYEARLDKLMQQNNFPQ